MGYTGEQHKQYELSRYHQRRSEAIHHLGGKCAICGTTSDLQLDHIDPREKDFAVSSEGWSLGKDTWWAEVLKCQLLCSLCHREKTNRDRQQGKGFREHGTWGTYGRGKCRCKQCKAFFNAYRQEWRRQQRSGKG